MFTKENCINYILDNIPEFRNSWEKHLNYWDGEEAGLCNDVSSFTDFTIVKIGDENQKLLTTIFGVTENLLKDGDEEVRTVIATCFLENILNVVSAGKIASSSFVDLLGENSKEYCKKWDEHTGVKTMGLW